MTLANIPAELRNYSQWITWKSEDRGGAKPTKIPYNVQSGYPAAVDNPHTWTGFEPVVHAVASGLVSGAGFILTANDPYSFIDLDDPKGDAAQIARYEYLIDSFNSYTEVSPSGRGVHIIVKGRVPSGKKRFGVEVYSELRYMTMTGNVLRNAPIAERQGLLDILWNELGGAENTANDAWDRPQTETDDEVCNRLAKASNAELFIALYAGDWQNRFASQSEADQALLNLLAFYSDNREQIGRIFRASGLGQRPKALRRDYVERSISKAFDLKIDAVDMTKMRSDVAVILEKRAAVENVQPDEKPFAQSTAAAKLNSGTNEPSFAQFHLLEPMAEVNRPPGLLGEVAQWIFDQAPRPVPEIALVGAIGLLAGICGQAFNISNTGLNQYIMFLAQTGTGKEAIASGISTLMTMVANDVNKSDKLTVEGVPAAANFIGPAEIQSAPALLKRLEKNSSFVTIIGEVGLLLSKWCNEGANGNDMMIKRALLDLYGKSGRNNVVREMIYSKNENSTQVVYAPAVSIIGETVPENFLKVVDEDMVSQGLLPRFLIMEYKGPRVASSKTYLTAVPSEGLVKGMRQICAYALLKMHERQPVMVQTSSEADVFMSNFDRYCDMQINSSSREVIRHLWNRAHLKVLRLSALVAVGCDPFNPIITLNNAHWAYSLVVNDIRRMLERFERGEVGKVVHENNKQDDAVLRICRDYVTGPFDNVSKYGVDEAQHLSKVIPYVYIQRRLVSVAAFRKDKQGATIAIRRSLQSLVDGGLIAEFFGNMRTTRANGARNFVITPLGLNV